MKNGGGGVIYDWKIKNSFSWFFKIFWNKFNLVINVWDEHWNFVNSTSILRTEIEILEWNSDDVIAHYSPRIPVTNLT
jgi:hypothetical protein